MFHDQDVKMGCLAESVALLSNTLMKTFLRKLKSVSPLLLEHILSSPILKELPRFAVVSVPHYYAVQGRCVNRESPNKALQNFVKSPCPWPPWTPPGPEDFFLQDSLDCSLLGLPLPFNPVGSSISTDRTPLAWSNPLITPWGREHDPLRLNIPSLPQNLGEVLMLKQVKG